MKRLCFVLLFVLAAGFIFAETAQHVARDADILLAQQEDRGANNRLFMETSIVTDHANRIRLNDYRSRFTALNGRIHQLRNQISVAWNVREPNVRAIETMRTQLQGLIDEHDRLTTELRQWVGTLR